VNAEKTSKRAMREPTRPTDGEGRRWSSNERQDSTGPAGVVAMACVKEESTGNTGSPNGERSWLSTGTPWGAGRAVWGGGQARSTDEAG